MNERILVVEDTEAILDAVTDALAAEGFEVQGTSNGKQGLEAAEAEPFDLVILDLMLPDTDGYAVSENLRRQYHSCMVPILMLTARTQSTEKLYGFGAGADAYMTKPYDAAELLGTIRQLLKDAGID